MSLTGREANFRENELLLFFTRNNYNGSYENDRKDKIMWKQRLKRQWDENPLLVISVGAFAATAAAKLLHEVTAASNARAWKLEVNRRIANQK